MARGHVFGGLPSTARQVTLADPQLPLELGGALAMSFEQMQCFHRGLSAVLLQFSHSLPPMVASFTNFIPRDVHDFGGRAPFKTSGLVLVRRGLIQCAALHQGGSLDSFVIGGYSAEIGDTDVRVLPERAHRYCRACLIAARPGCGDRRGTYYALRGRSMFCSGHDTKIKSQ